MTADDAIRDLAATGNEPPRAAMQWALDHWEEAGPRFLGLLGAYTAGTETSEAAERALFPVLHLLAERREAGAFAPLCRLLADAETAELVLGDALGTTLPGLLISTFDGDAAALQGLIEAEQVEESARESALLALAYLTRAGAVPEAGTRAFLERLPDAMQPQAEHSVWLGWVLAVACLGYGDLAAPAEALIRDGLVPRGVLHVSHFRQDLRRAQDDPAGMAGFEALDIGPFTDAVGTLAEWSFGEGDEEDAPQEPYVNPLRGVGRNDPCPCGSGRKYKKCCMPA